MLLCGKMKGCPRILPFINYKQFTMKSLYDKWNEGLAGFTNFGSYQTTILQAYRIADNSNRAILEKAYPWWFAVNPEKIEPEPSIYLPDDVRENLLCSALEGGSNYWYWLPSEARIIFEEYRKEKREPIVNMMFKAIQAGHKIPVHDAETIDDENDGDLLGYISKESIEKGERIMFEKHNQHYSDARNENDDATTGDVWFQLAVMGEIVYG